MLRTRLDQRIRFLPDKHYGLCFSCLLYYRSHPRCQALGCGGLSSPLINRQHCYGVITGSRPSSERNCLFSTAIRIAVDCAMCSPTLVCSAVSTTEIRWRGGVNVDLRRVPDFVLHTRGLVQWRSSRRSRVGTAVGCRAAI